MRGFVSRIDGSVQPYGLTIPASYDGKRPMRLDIWLHGTQQQNNEVRFLQQQAGPHETSQIPGRRLHHGRAVRADEPLVQVLRRDRRVRGDRGVRKHYNIDPERIVIRGHSMGGHQGSARLAIQNPTFFAAFESSAGYSETRDTPPRARP